MKDKLIKWALSSVLIMNGIDAIASLWFIKYKAILEEANPLAKVVMELGDVPFVVVKTLIVGMGVYVLWEKRSHPLALIGTYIGFITYMSLMWGFYLFLS